MMPRTSHLQIDFNLCHACRRCLASQVCRMKAILQVDPDEPPYLEVERCRDCRVCMPACPFGAIVMARYEA
jgi:Fe-S-cluster-containing hydrogenase component 2